MKLTKPQREELKRLAQGPQPTNSRSRAHVQKNLVNMGLARLYNVDKLSKRFMPDTCAITDEGRAAISDE